MLCVFLLVAGHRDPSPRDIRVKRDDSEVGHGTVGDRTPFPDNTTNSSRLEKGEEITQPCEFMFLKGQWYSSVSLCFLTSHVEQELSVCCVDTC